MPRLAIPALDDVPAATRPVLDAVRAQLGFVPNLHRLMASSPAVLAGFAGLQGALSRTLDIKTRDAIALAVSEADGCAYCLAAHSYIARNFAKMSPDEVALNRQGRSSDPKRAAAAHFAKALVETRGHVDDAELAAVRAAGFSDANVLEIVALTAQFLMTNFINTGAGTEVDFPAAAPAQAA